MPARKTQPDKLRKPSALREGDTVGIVAPASPVEKDALEAGCARLHALGYKTFYLPSILETDLFFAGSIKRRCRELEEMFERDDVRAVLCARGGYGTNTLLEHLDVEKIARHPKIFMGYSDITSLLTYFHDYAGLVTFHGPMLAKDFAVASHVDEESWKRATGGERNWSAPATDAAPVVGGRAEGRLYGGCLSMLVASLGTPYEIETEGTLLFLEDINVKPFQIDRMLMQLKLAGKLKGVRGVIFGEMLDCGEPNKVMAAVRRVLQDLEVPVAFRLRSGHVTSGNVTLPIGVKASLKVDMAVELTILESAVATETKSKVLARAKA